MGTRVNCRDGLGGRSFEWQPISKTLTRARKMSGRLCLRQEVSAINLINLQLLRSGRVGRRWRCLQILASLHPTGRGQIPSMPSIILNPIVTASHNVPTLEATSPRPDFAAGRMSLFHLRSIPTASAGWVPNDFLELHQFVFTRIPQKWLEFWARSRVSGVRRKP